jgi:TIR domain
MNVFLSYASEEHDLASGIAHVLRDEGQSVFLDRDSLRAGETYDRQIREAIQCCDLFVFLVSPASIAPGSYSLAECSIAESVSERREIPVLPVMVSATDFALIPPFLRTLTVLQPRGDIASETLAAIEDIRAELVRRQTKITIQPDDIAWTINFNLYDVREIFYRFSDAAGFKSTGFLPYPDPRTGRPIPMFFITVPAAEITRTLEYRYVDHRGRECGPFTFAIDQAAQTVVKAKTLLEMTRPSIHIHAAKDGRVFALFRPLVICREALREIHYSIDDHSLTSRCSPEADEEVIEVPPATSCMYVKLLFIDGTETVPERCVRT